MKTTLLSMRPKLAFATVSAMLAIAGLTTALKVPAAQTDISQSPVASSATAVVKPNIMLLMDTSGSMGYTHMPDEIEGNDAAFPIGYRSYQCNALYYNPNKQYRVPKGADGTTLAVPSFTAAPYNYFSTDTTVVDLSSAFTAYDITSRRNNTDASYSDRAQKAYYFVYSGPQVSTLSYKTAPCTDPDNTGINAESQTNATGGGLWYRKIVSTTSGPGASDERQNFANWYTFYRTRLALTKSGVSLAFSSLSDRYRVGFSSMNPTTNPGVQDSPVSAAKYLPLADFDMAQRTAWFAKLFGQTASGSSPAREALARIGRLYAGKTDYINKNMGPDPVQYSCQQNFTIMTTDGYWNTAQESRGPVGLDGQTKVGQQDGTLTDNSGLTPRPIWDGGIGGSRVTTDKSNEYSTTSCYGGYFTQTIRQILVATSRITATTSQMQQRTSQINISTSQTRKTETQILRATNQLTRATAQTRTTDTVIKQTDTQTRATAYQIKQYTKTIMQKTRQDFASTQQWLQRTSQNRATVSTLNKNTYQNLAATFQNLQRIQQLQQRTSQTKIVYTTTSEVRLQYSKVITQKGTVTTQTLATTSYTDKTTSQIKKSTSQRTAATSQLTIRTSQIREATSQITKSTSQLTRSTLQIKQSTSQTFADDAANETSTAVASCTPGGYISCRTVNSNPAAVASCTQTDGQTSPFIRTVCATTTTGPTGVASCSPVDPVGPNYIKTTCATLTTGPTGVQSCTASGSASTSPYLVTTCANPTTNNPVASCTPVTAADANGWTTVTCTTVNNPTSGATGTDSCTGATANNTNNYTNTICNTVTTPATGVQTCTDASPNSGNQYTQTSCSTVVTSNVPTDACVQASASTNNSWTTTTCDTSSTTVRTDSCTSQNPVLGNNYVKIACVTTNDGGVGVPSCSSQSPNINNGYATVTCSNSRVPATGSTPVQTCTSQNPDASNQYKTITCVDGSLARAAAFVASCTPVTGTSPNWATTVCNTPVNSTTSPVDTCSAVAPVAGNNYLSVTCPTSSTVGAAVDPATCTPSGPNASNGHRTVTCPVTTTGPTGVQTCIGGGPAGPNWITTTCTNYDSGNTAVLTCAGASANSGNSWTTTSCGTNNTSATPVQTCTNANAISTNSFTRTVCSTNNTGPTADPSCVASTPTSSPWITVTCTTSSATNPAATCTPSANTTCNVVNTGPTPVQTCTPGNSGSPNFITTTCENATTTNQLVNSCVAGNSGSPNWITTTCTFTESAFTAVPSCTAGPATDTNGHTTVSCNTVTSTPVYVASCTPVLSSPGNGYTETVCDTTDTTKNYTDKYVDTASCSNITPSAGNNYESKVCTTNVTGPTAVASCAIANPTLGNNYLKTECTTSSNVYWSATCTAANARNNNGYTKKTCEEVTTPAVGVQTCSVPPSDASNDYTRVTCATVATSNVGVASCTDAAASSTNSWTTTTCNNSVINSFVAQAACVQQTGNATNEWKTISCATTNTGPTPTDTCVAGTDGNMKVTTCNTVLGGPTGVQTCTPSGPNAGNDYKTITCQLVEPGPQGVASCTNSGPTDGNGYMTTTCATATTDPTPTSSCTNAPASGTNNWTTISCSSQLLDGTPKVTQVCNPAGATSANDYKSTTCDAIPGEKLQYKTTTTTKTYLTSGTIAIGDPTNETTSVSGISDVDGVCHVIDKTTYVKPANGRPTGTLPPVADATTCRNGWPCSVDTANSANSGSQNSLADVAQYYYVTDLRPDQQNDVATTGTGPEDDRAAWQHMTTFSLGLGVSGTLNYDSNYKSATTGDFADIRSGVKNWPAWPDASIDYTASPTLYNDARSIDDFWHAAVNGRGRYFSANDPDAVINGLNDALAGIKSRSGSGASATLSNPAPSAGDNLAFITSFTSEKWTGNLEAYEIDLATGNISNTSAWSAQPRVDAVAGASCDSRKIYTYRAGASNNFGQFTWNTRACDAALNPIGATSTDLTTEQQELFSITQASTLTQYLDMTDGLAGTQNQRAVVAGSNLVNYLRGQRGMEGFVSNNAAKLYRSREHVLGDLVGSQPAYVKAPSSSYQDAGYTAFKADNAARTPVVYVGGNDGMLHAFKAPTTLTDGTAGNELWAFMPTPVMKNLFRLADTEYGAQHIFAVDGSPVSGDFYDTTSNTWKTMLVGGLGAGGKGYYALDVTNPTSPKALWEFTHGDTCFVTQTGTPAFTDCHLGLTFGKPLVTKLQDGRWVVIVASGYNNVNSPAKTGDGVGYVYVLSAATGEILYKIATNEGTSDSPSGLRELSNYVPAPEVDNTTQRVYGGDLNGWIYRVDVNGIYEPTGREASKVARALDANNAPQPITTRVQLAEYDGKTVLLAGTGQLLGTSDVLTTQTQSVYGFFDSLTSSIVIDNLRTTLKPMTLTTVGTGSTATRTIACAADTVAKCNVIGNWYLDLNQAGERISVDMRIALGTLTFTSNVPESSACSAGGTSWINYVDLLTGNSVSSSADGVVSRRLSDTLTTGLTLFLSNGGVRFISQNAQTRGGTTGTGNSSIGPISGAGGLSNTGETPTTPQKALGRRISWREITENN